MKKKECYQEENIRDLFTLDKKKAVCMEGMSVKIANIEETTRRLEKKMDAFIDSANNKYATKTELANVERNLKDYNINQDKETGWIRENLMEIIWKVSTVAGIVYLIIQNWG